VLNLSDEVKTEPANQESTAKRGGLFILVALLTFLNTGWIAFHIVSNLRGAVPGNAVTKPSSGDSVTPAPPQRSTAASSDVAATSSDGNPGIQTPAPAEQPHTYTAYLSCHLANQALTSILPCFAGDSAQDPGTDLEVRNGTEDRIYKVYDMQQAGTASADGLVLHLQNHFEIKAQNASANLVLALRIVDNNTGGSVFNKQVGQYGVIDAVN